MFVEREGLEGVFDSWIEACVVEGVVAHLFGLEAEGFEDGDAWDAQAADRVPDANGADGDVDACEAASDEFVDVFFAEGGFVGEGQVWVLGDIVFVGSGFDVFEDLAEEGKALAGEEAEFTDQTGDGSCGERAAAEANKEDLVAGSPIYGDEGVAFSNVCFEAKACCFAHGSTDLASLRTDAGLVMDYLWYTVSTCVLNSPADAGYVARWLCLAVE